MKNLTIIEAINELIKGVNIGYHRQAYSMAESRDILNAIEFLSEALSAPKPPTVPVTSTADISAVNIASTEVVDIIETPAVETPTA